ncbi:hypothetical protein QBC41DRAFT_393878 [Cercophora samala]|uniref:Uncharacterized protein n=1 Tax=Cercophora samala TaxID=330535 RepID=A0AA39ZCF6_9PEZI|nr:hypothetical protein QBC41DRAFT_393878 [Cercophora samala]
MSRDKDHSSHEPIDTCQRCAWMEAQTARERAEKMKLQKMIHNMLTEVEKRYTCECTSCVEYKQHERLNVKAREDAEKQWEHMPSVYVSQTLGSECKDCKKKEVALYMARKERLITDAQLSYLKRPSTGTIISGCKVRPVDPPAPTTPLDPEASVFHPFVHEFTEAIIKQVTKPKVPKSRRGILKGATISAEKKPYARSDRKPVARNLCADNETQIHDFVSRFPETDEVIKKNPAVFRPILKKWLVSAPTESKLPYLKELVELCMDRRLACFQEWAEENWEALGETRPAPVKAESEPSAGPEVAVPAPDPTPTPVMTTSPVTAGPVMTTAPPVMTTPPPIITTTPPVATMTSATLTPPATPTTPVTPTTFVTAATPVITTIPPVMITAPVMTTAPPVMTTTTPVMTTAPPVITITPATPPPPATPTTPARAATPAALSPFVIATPVPTVPFPTTTAPEVHPPFPTRRADPFVPTSYVAAKVPANIIPPPLHYRSTAKPASTLPAPPAPTPAPAPAPAPAPTSPAPPPPAPEPTMPHPPVITPSSKLPTPRPYPALQPTSLIGYLRFQAQRSFSLAAALHTFETNPHLMAPPQHVTFIYYTLHYLSLSLDSSRNMTRLLDVKFAPFDNRPPAGGKVDVVYNRLVALIKPYADWVVVAMTRAERAGSSSSSSSSAAFRYDHHDELMAREAWLICEVWDREVRAAEGELTGAVFDRLEPVPRVAKEEWVRFQDRLALFGQWLERGVGGRLLVPFPW